MFKILTIHIITIVLLLKISNTTSLPVDYVILFITLLMLARFVLKREKFDRRVVLLFGLWFLINYVSSIVFSRSFNFPLVTRLAFQYVLFPYLLLNRYKESIFIILEKYIFSLTALSIPLFILNWIFLAAFNDLASTFARITNPAFSNSMTYWSSVVYVNAIFQSYQAYDLLRNCGFMWEPGYFAVVIIFGIGFNWLLSGIKFNLKFIIYLIALLTTFSTAGYISLVIILSIALLRKINILRIVLLLSLLILFSSYVYKMEFMGGKIAKNIEYINEDTFNYVDAYQSVKLSRLQIAIYDIDRLARYPFGFGINDRVSFENVDVVGTNGLTGLLKMWGVFIFVYFIICIFKFHLIFNCSNLGIREITLIFASLMVVFFSQSVQYNILVYLIIFSAIVFKKDYVPAKYKY